MDILIPSAWVKVTHICYHYVRIIEFQYQLGFKFIKFKILKNSNTIKTLQY
jgi:hypothetical protein